MGNLCGGTKGKYHDSSETHSRISTEELDSRVREFLDKEHLREEEAQKNSRAQNINEIFGNSTTSWGDISKVYLIKQEKIGQGHFGVVRRAQLISHPEKTFAIKEICKEKALNDIHLLKMELDIMRSLDHPNIIKFFEAYQDPKKLYISMEYCSGGDLLNKLRAEGPIPEDEAKKIMKQVFSSVIHLHSRGIVHRDLKPENFLFTNQQKKEIKLIDFGLSRHIEAGAQLKSVLGTPYYVAPEVLKGNYDMKADIWSCGVIMYLLLCGDWPFNDPNGDEKAIFNKILKGKFDFKGRQWGNVSQEAKHLLKCLIEPDPTKRINGRVALLHPWFEQLNAKDRAFYRASVSHRTIELLRNFRINKTRMQIEVIKIMVNMLSDHELTAIKDAFKYANYDGSGIITLQEMMDVMKELGYNDSEEEVKEMISNISRMDAQFIGYIEFIAATLERSVYMNLENLKSAFRYFDTDGNGVITPENLKESFARFGRKLTDKDIYELIKEVDSKGDRQICWEEFLDFMQISNLEKSEIKGKGPGQRSS